MGCWSFGPLRRQLQPPQQPVELRYLLLAQTTQQAGLVCQRQGLRLTQ